MKDGYGKRHVKLGVRLMLLSIKNILPLIFLKRLSDVFEDETNKLVEEYEDKKTLLDEPIKNLLIKKKETFITVYDSKSFIKEFMSINKYEYPR